MAQRFPRFYLLLAFFAAIVMLLPAAAHAEGAMPGDGQAGDQPPPPSIESTINSAYVWFGVEQSKTTIWMRVCSDAPYTQVRSEMPGNWITEVFNKTEKSNGCSPATTYGWRMVYLADPGMQFHIYATASETFYSEAAFMERASRTTCTVTGLGTGTCTPSTNLAAISAPRGSIDAPGEGATISGTVNVSGWAIDIGTWSGTGVDAVHVYYGNTFLGAAGYGGARGDVAGAQGDSRYTNSGWGYSLNTASLPNGAGAIRVAYRSTVNGAWTWMQRNVTVNNATPPPPDTTPPDGAITAPAEGARVGNSFTISANASDNAGGSGVNKVDFFVAYNGRWYGIGSDTAAPYQATVNLPAGTPSQTVLVTIHVYDKAGNKRMDPGGYRRVGFIASGNSLQERWVPAERRAYLNQRALGANGNSMCSMASIAMVRAMNGLIGRDTPSLVAEAQRAWNTGMRGPGVGQVRNYLNNNGMSAWIIWTQDKTAHWKAIKAEIDAGRPVILNSNSGGGNLTSYGHYIVVVGYSEGGNPARQIIVYDPYGRWLNVINKYDRNDTTHNPPNGVKGRWVYYNFDNLGTIYSITAARTSVAGVSELVSDTLPDEIVPGATEDIGLYTGHDQSQFAVSIFLPDVHRP